jgi:hypothetical protein
MFILTISGPEGKVLRVTSLRMKARRDGIDDGGREG